MDGVWKACLTIACWVTILFGAMLAAAAFPGTDALTRFWYQLVSNFEFEPGFIEAPGMRFTLAVLGGVMVGWGITLMALIQVAGVVGRPAWRGLTAALLAWYVIDSSLSVVTGYPLNALANTGFLLLFLVPVLASGALKARA